MSSKRVAKNKDEDKKNTDSKNNKKSTKKVLAKGEGMGGTIGLIEKPVKKCMTAKRDVCPPVACPSQPIICPSVCCQQICYFSSADCHKPC